MKNRSNHQRCFVTEEDLRKFVKFTGKHLCQSLFLINLQAEAYNFIRKEALPQVFSSEFCKISKNTFFTEYLRTTASGKTNYVNLAS